MQGCYGFAHPVTGETMIFESEMPQDLANLARSLQEM